MNTADVEVDGKIRVKISAGAHLQFSSITEGLKKRDGWLLGPGKNGNGIGGRCSQGRRKKGRNTSSSDVGNPAQPKTSMRNIFEKDVPTE